MHRKVLLFSVVITTYLLALLYTFNLNDPAWNFASPITSYHNIGGIFGAWFADILFTIFGITAWLLPPATSGIVWLCYTRAVQLGDLCLKQIAIKISSLLLILVSGSAISSLHFHRLDQILPAKTGGVIGDLASSFPLLFIGNFGSTTLFLMLFLKGTSLFVNLSWLTIIENIGAIILQELSRIRRVS